LRDMNLGFWQLVGGRRDFSVKALHYFLLIQVQAIAICSQKGPVVHAAGQLAVSAFLEAFEIMQADARIRSDLSKRDISFFAFGFKIRCKRSHSKIRVMQKGYYIG